MTEAITKPETTPALSASEAAIAAIFADDSPIQIPTDAPMPCVEIMRESQQFKLPDGSKVAEISGYILHWHEANAYWDQPYGTDGADVFPTCSSSDNRTPDSDEQPGGVDPISGKDLPERRHQHPTCQGCPRNEWGTDPKGGRGKACQNMQRLYFLIDGQRMPFILKAPPSSVASKGELVAWEVLQASVGLRGRYQFTHVQLKLYKKVFDKFEASVIEPVTIKVLDKDDEPEILRVLELYRQCMKYHKKRAAEDMAAESQDGTDEAKDGATDSKGGDTPF